MSTGIEEYWDNYRQQMIDLLSDLGITGEDMIFDSIMDVVDEAWHDGAEWAKEQR